MKMVLEVGTRRLFELLYSHLLFPVAQSLFVRELPAVKHRKLEAERLQRKHREPLVLR